jgi:subtilisin family serine protease
MTHRSVCACAGAVLAAVSGMAAGAGKDALSPGAQARLAAGTPVKLWVSFTDKDLRTPQERAAALERLAATYDPHAIERRRLRRTRPGLFDESDIPVAARYRDAVAATGATLLIESPWLNAVSVRPTPAQARAIAALPFVRRIDPVLGGRRLTPPGAEERPTPVPPPAGDDFYGLASEQLNQIALPALHSQGFTGTGIRIGILDTGFKRTHAAFNQPGHVLQVIAEHDFVNNDGNTGPEPGDDPGQHWHGTLILGCLGAYKPDELVGGAYNAAFILCKTEDITSETPIEEDNYVGGLQLIEANGGDVATASLVYIDWYSYSQLNGHTAVTTLAVNMATANGVYCCNAAGNAGHDADPATGHLGGAPADAYQVLSVGAVTNEGSITGFSSDGPTADGRLKPEVLARGADTFSVNPDDDAGYASASGTSLSTPLAACAVACLAHAHPGWTVGQMREALMLTASDFVADGQPDPLLVRGFGIINAAAASAFCYANCDSSTVTPALTVSDFACFLNRFAAGSAYANCDGSTGTPALTVSDFACFLNRFAAGCS